MPVKKKSEIIIIIVFFLVCYFYSFKNGIKEVIFDGKKYFSKIALNLTIIFLDAAEA